MLCPVALGGTSRFLDAVRSDCNVALLKRREFRRRFGTRQRAMGRKESRDGVFYDFLRCRSVSLVPQGSIMKQGLLPSLLRLSPSVGGRSVFLDRRGKPAGAGGGTAVD
jgi:hypothetical protein